MSSTLRIERFGTAARFLTTIALSALPLPAQEALTLRQAVDLALHSNPLFAASDAGEKEAKARIHQAHSGEIAHIESAIEDKSIYHKNLMPVTYVTADLAGVIESPVYAMLKVGAEIDRIQTP